MHALVFRSPRAHEEVEATAIRRIPRVQARLTALRYFNRLAQHRLHLGLLQSCQPLRALSELVLAIPIVFKELVDVSIRLLGRVRQACVNRFGTLRQAQERCAGCLLARLY